MNTITRTTRAAGFTLTEMMVAVGITAALIVGLNQLFANVTDAVQRGLATSDILQNARIIADTIQIDAINVAPPEEGGLLVIVDDTVDAKYMDDDEMDESAIQSDQLAFIRRRERLQPVVPVNQFGFPGAPSNAGYTRVWYGHVERLTADGRDNGKLGEAGEAGETSNEFAADWVLGRQVIYFDPGYPGSTNVDEPGGGYEDISDFASDGYRALKDVVKVWLSGTDESLHAHLADGSYPERAIDLVYPDEDQRLKVLVRPQVLEDGEESELSKATFENELIAKMHPMLATNVSNFVVEYAGDLEAPFDGRVDEDSDGGIKWYSGRDRPNNPNLMTYDNNAVVFRHGTGALFPDLIRIRFRVNDPSGQLSGPDGLPGRWFEQIIRIPRGS